MANKNYFQKFSYTLANNEIKTIETHANFFYLISNSSSTEFLVSLGEQAFQSFPTGLSIQLMRDENEVFTKIQIQNISGGNADISFALSNGIISNNSSTVSGTVTTDETPNGIQTDAAITVSTTPQTIAADSAQEYLILDNISTTIDIWYGQVGQVDPATNKGTRLRAGDVAVIAGNFAVEVETASSTAIVSINRLRKT